MAEKLVQTPEEEVRKRKRWRVFATIWALGGGLLLVFLGRDWLINGLPAPWVGYALIVVSILGVLRVNVFYGGPLDLRLDRLLPSSQDTVNSTESPRSRGADSF